VRKTSICFSYTFGPRYGRDGKPYLGARPSNKSLRRIKGKIGDLLKPCETGDWPGVRKRLNRLIGGWSAYFGYGTLNAAYRAVDRHLSRPRPALPQPARQARRAPGARVFSWNEVFGKLGVQRLTRDKPAALGP